MLLKRSLQKELLTVKYGEKIEKKEITIKVIHIATSITEQVSPCCGLVTKRIHDKRVRNLRHIEIGGHRSHVIFKYRRYKCDCGKNFPEKYYFADAYNRITKSTQIKILEKLFETRSFAPIGRELGISSMSCINYFRKHTNTMFESIKLSETLSFDEFAAHTSFGKYASIVADKFHFLRHVFWAFNHVRLDTMKTFKKGSYEYFIFKKYWKVLTKTFDTLNPKMFYSHKLKHDTNTYQIVDYALNNSTNDFQTAYRLKEEMFNIKYSVDKDNVKESLREWLNKVKEFNNPRFNEAYKAINNWFTEVSNTYIYEDNLSNGFTEGINNYIKTMKRQSYGFKNFDLFRKKILFTHNFGEVSA